MNFIVKDLMISVLPLRGLNIDDISSCGACTSDSTAPGPCGRTDRRESWWELATNPSSPVSLAALKQQLREALAAVEAREKVVHENMRPKSAAEIDILQVHLTAALEELKESTAKLHSR